MSNLTGLAFRSNPFLATRKEVEEWLKGQPDKTATSFRCGEEKLLLVWRSGVIEVIDATRIPRSAFIGTSLDDEQVAALAARIDGIPVVDEGVKTSTSTLAFQVALFKASTFLMVEAVLLLSFVSHRKAGENILTLSSLLWLRTGRFLEW